MGAESFTVLAVLEARDRASEIFAKVDESLGKFSDSAKTAADSARGAGEAIVTPAPPEWASPEFTEAVTGGLFASVEGYCSRCEAVARPPLIPLGEVACVSQKVPHAAWCARSEETLKQLEEACRPPGARWVADDTPETMARLNEHLETLAARLNSERTPD